MSKRSFFDFDRRVDFRSSFKQYVDLFNSCQRDAIVTPRKFIELMVQKYLEEDPRIMEIIYEDLQDQNKLAHHKRSRLRANKKKEERWAEKEMLEWDLSLEDIEFIFDVIEGTDHD